MKTMKKNYFITPLLIMISVFLKAQNFTESGLNYSVIDAVNFYVTVGDNQGATGSVIILDNVTYNGQVYTVTTIKDYAFSGSSISSVVIPNSVVTIVNDAFANCASLTNVTVGNSVSTVGNGAFYKCTSLPSISFPDSLTSLGSLSFFACTSLETVILGDAIITIGDQSFAWCSLLDSFSIATVVPAVINANVFEGLASENINLLVPSSGSAAYQAAAVWLNFSHGVLSSQKKTKIFAEVYPNPVINNFQIRLPGNMVLQNVLIYNMVGQLVLISNVNMVDISELPNGQYNVFIETSNGNSVKRIVKK
ncbi:leucine-rich repeat domain-containing protein [Flavicella marina]|uniref:leucine-rich repeat domain-containing protein n=1 Tax=Flavicella marina TaxID=1475951 RepID=UPI001264D054|nr:leucine-rich repeat domain-containing protein [Flavicella marina]